MGLARLRCQPRRVLIMRRLEVRFRTQTKRTYVKLISLHQPRRPADADKKTVRSAYTHLVKTPFAVAQNPTRTDNQVVHPRGDCVDMGRANENAKWVVGFRHPPWAVSRLRQMHLAIPTSHDDVVGITACAREAQ